MPTTIRLGLQDRMFLLADTRETPMHVGGLQVFRIPPRTPAHFVARLYDEMRAYPVSVPPLNYRLAGGLTGKVLPSWEVADDVDLGYHFRHSALPSPGGERELGELVSRLHSNHMDLSRPLWEYHLISGLTGRRFAIYTKLHHAMFDGAAGMRLMNFSTDPATSFGPPFWADGSRRREEPDARPSPLLEWLPALVEDEVKSLPSLVRGLAATAGAAIGVGAPPDLTSIAEAPRMLFNVRVSAQRRVATYAVRLARLQAVGKATGATVNEVLLGVCSGALRRYLLERDALPGESLISAVPMALHHEEGAAAGNAVTCLNARLGTDIEDVCQRFETICRTSAAGKAQLRGMTRTAAMHFATLLSVPLLVSWLPGMDRLIGPQSNLLISNVPGPRKRLYFHGAGMLAHYPVSQVGHGIALNITVISYAGGLYFGLVACPEAVPSVQRLAIHMEASMQELEATFRDAPRKRQSGKTRGARKPSTRDQATRTRRAAGATRRPR